MLIWRATITQARIDSPINTQPAWQKNDTVIGSLYISMSACEREFNSLFFAQLEYSYH